MVHVVLATLLNEHHTNLLRTFLEQDVSANLFALCVLEHWGVTGLRDAQWWGVFDERDLLCAVCYAGAHNEESGFGMVVPYGRAAALPMVGMALAMRGGARWVVGERSACDALWEGLEAPKPRIQSDQVLFETTEISEGPTVDLRIGNDEDFDWLLMASSRMVQEDLNLSWAGQSQMEFSTRMKASIREGSEYIGSKYGQRMFRAERGVRGSYGAQIGGIWVDPDQRGMGIGKAGTRTVVNALLAELPRVTLHVRANNDAAIRCYESIGFRSIRAFRLLVR